MPRLPVDVFSRSTRSGPSYTRAATGEPATGEPATGGTLRIVEGARVIGVSRGRATATGEPATGEQLR